jgi:hypothetical protein
LDVRVYLCNGRRIAAQELLAKLPGLTFELGEIGLGAECTGRYAGTDGHDELLPPAPGAGREARCPPSSVAANVSHVVVVRNHRPSTVGPRQIEGPLTAKSVSFGAGKYT